VFDGFGSGDAQSFCGNPGDGWSSNNLDIEPFCFNEDISVFNVDDCGVCNGGNQDCLDEIFYYLPYNLHALINDGIISISWNFDSNLEDSFIQGFNI
jgi:hypothetical protein